jgi:hypothetical protein
LRSASGVEISNGFHLSRAWNHILKMAGKTKIHPPKGIDPT